MKVSINGVTGLMSEYCYGQVCGYVLKCARTCSNMRTEAEMSNCHSP